MLSAFKYGKVGFNYR